MIGRIWLFLACVMLVGCAGTGPSTSSGSVIGRVLNVSTGGPPNPAATVQIASATTTTSLADGSFTLAAQNGTTALTVDNGFPPAWVFSIGPVDGNTDVGDLWVGPERVTLTGVVRDATTNAIVPGAIVRFGGRIGQTNLSGVFSLIDVAYSSATQTAFWGIVGDVRATGFFRTEFSAQPNIAVGGVVDVGDILITPTSDPNPPGIPYNIWGVVTAPGGAIGSIVRLKQGGSDVRVFNVGADGRYLFFVVPGTYTISASKGASTAPDIVVTLTQPNEVIRRDVTIP